MTSIELYKILEEVGITDPTFFYKNEDEKLEIVLSLLKKLR